MSPPVASFALKIASFGMSGDAMVSLILHNNTGSPLLVRTMGLRGRFETHEE